MRRLGSVAFRAFAMLGLVYLALPIVVVIGASFTGSGFVAFPPHGLTLKWYQAFVDRPGWLDSFRLSFMIAAAATLLTPCAGIPAALVLVRYRFPGRAFLASLFLSPLVLPQIVLGVGLLSYLTVLGVARTFWAILVGHVVLAFPYVVRTVMASLAGFDEAQEEAAADLGAPPLVAFFTVTLPSIKAGVVAGALFAFVISWTNVEVSMFFATPTIDPLPVNIMNYIAYNFDPLITAVSAASVYVSFALLLLIDGTVGLERFATGGPR